MENSFGTTVEGYVADRNRKTGVISKIKSPGCVFGFHITMTCKTGK